MTNFTKGQDVEILEGGLAGEVAFFYAYSRRPGSEQWCFVQLKRPTMKMLQLKLTEIRAA